MSSIALRFLFECTRVKIILFGILLKLEFKRIGNGFKMNDELGHANIKLIKTDSFLDMNHIISHVDFMGKVT